MAILLVSLLFVFNIYFLPNYTVSTHHHNWAAVVSRGWAKASACRLQITLSCAFLCHIVSLQYLYRSSLHRLAGLICRHFLSDGLQVVTREVNLSSLRLLICPAQSILIHFPQMEDYVKCCSSSGFLCVGVRLIYWSLRSMATFVICFHWSLLLAFSLHFSSSSAFLRSLFTHLSCGLPRFLEPSCLFVSALFDSLSSFIRTMCPAHFIRSKIIILL